MNKRFFTFLIILMGFSILGVIAVQLVWMNNALKVKNELFDRSVNEALSNTANRLETERDVKYIARFPFEKEIQKHVQWITSSKVPPAPPANPVKIIRHMNTPGNVEFEFEMDADEDVQVIAFTSEDSLQVESKVFVELQDTIYTNTDVLLTSTHTHLNSIEKIFDSIVEVSPVVISPTIQEKVKIRTKKLKSLSEKIVEEISTEKIDVDLNEIDEILGAELANKKIELDYELAILENDSIQSITNETDSLKLADSNYHVILFPNAIFDRNKKLAVFFPGQNQFIYRSVSWLLFASFIFSLIILLTFALSIFFILKQKKISEMKSDFINNMTHEFKTPIATISVAADSISNEKVIGNPKQIDYFVGMIKKENTRMNRQVEDILTIARLDKEDFEFHWETVNIHQIIEEAINSIILQVEKRGGVVKLALDATNPMITTDKNHCTNLIYNLLDNANKYSTDKPQIQVGTKNTDKGVVVSISDKGIGMSKQVQSKIFERFYRQSSGNIHNVKGFGLGLSYVKAVLEANEGTINLQSEVGKGSRFDVFLPFLRE